MRNEIAEWMISRVAPPEQAATIVGDLLEAQPGPVEFWFAVARAMMSIARHQPRSVLSWFVWFSYELSAYAFLAWFFTRLYEHTFRHPWVAFGTFVALWLAIGWVLGWRRARSSGFGYAAFCMWLLVHDDGLQIWSALLIVLTAFAVFSWRRQSLRKRATSSMENDRPVAG